jgi:N-acyl homoserine lactone hydrolase
MDPLPGTAVQEERVTIDASDVQRLHLGHYTLGHTLADGTTHPYSGRQIVVTGFLIRHPEGPFLFDTGFGVTTNEAIEAYKTVRRDITDALRVAGVVPKDVRAIANCHLHFDHGGGNQRFPGTTIIAQKAEVDNAHGANYTIATDVIDFTGARFETLDGEGQIADGLRIIPTPGHTSGHQSLVVETKQGRVILSGQAHNFASDFATHRYARELAARGEPHTDYPAWMDRFAELDPWRVMFAHDYALWERPGAA